MNQKIKELLADFLGIAGLAMLAYGLWLIAPLVMFIIIGILLIISAIILSRGTQGKKARG